MNILNSVKSVLGGGENKQNDLMSSIMFLVGSESGGLNGLISQFKRKVWETLFHHGLEQIKIFRFLPIRLKVFWEMIPLKKWLQSLEWTLMH